MKMIRCHRILLLSLIPVVAGCAALEPGVYDPEMDDRKLAVHVLKSQSREAQRMIAALRSDVEANKETLAATQIARAQLEGQLREVERRYDEARQIIDLQREELARLRDEREEVLRASRGIRTEMSRLQRQIAALTGSRKSHTRGPDQGEKSPPEREASARLTAHPAVEEEMANPLHNGTEPEQTFNVGDVIPDLVVVRPGDTLWSIARRYKVSYPALRSLNGLDENPDLIFVGQELLLPE